MVAETEDERAHRLHSHAARLKAELKASRDAGPDEFLSDIVGPPQHETLTPDELAKYNNELPDAVRRAAALADARWREAYPMPEDGAPPQTKPCCLTTGDDECDAGGEVKCGAAPQGGAVKKNRELQRLPSEEAQRAALRSHVEYGSVGQRYPAAVSTDPIYGMLRAQLKLLQSADDISPARRGPKPKRGTLLRILDILEERDLPLHTSKNSRVASEVGHLIHRSPEQTADLLHQLRDMAEKHKIEGSAEEH